MAIALAVFHTLGKRPISKHLFMSVYQNEGRILCILFTITPSIPSGPGHFLSSSFLMTSFTSRGRKFGTAWESGGFVPATCTLMFLCCVLSLVVVYSGKNLRRRAFAVSFADVVTASSGRVSVVRTGFLPNPALLIL